MVIDRRNARAIALVDVLVASIILGVALVALVSLAGRAAGALASGDRLRAAAMLIDERLGLVLALGPEGYRSAFPERGRCDPPFDDFTYEVRLESRAAGDPWRVAVSVSWTTAGRARTETVETLLAPRRGERTEPDRRPEESVTRGF